MRAGQTFIFRTQHPPPAHLVRGGGRAPPRAELCACTREPSTNRQKRRSCRATFGPQVPPGSVGNGPRSRTGGGARSHPCGLPSRGRPKASIHGYPCPRLLQCPAPQEPAANFRTQTHRLVGTCVSVVPVVPLLQKYPCYPSHHTPTLLWRQAPVRAEACGASRLQPQGPPLPSSLTPAVARFLSPLPPVPGGT